MELGNPKNEGLVPYPVGEFTFFPTVSRLSEGWRLLLGGQIDEG